MARRRTTEEQAARDMLQAEHDRNSGLIDMLPTWLAGRVAKRLDPENKIPPIARALMEAHLRAMARQVCSGRADRDDDDDEQHEMFPGLQVRYPVAHHGNMEPAYRRKEDMTDEDFAWNISRLESESGSKQKHASSLRAYWRKLRRDGVPPEPPIRPTPIPPVSELPA